jgi:signal transduction histidine kinase
MNFQDRTKKQLLNDLRQSEFEISELKKAEENYKKIAEALNQERELYTDLANALPSGIYRLRVFYALSLIDDKWSSSNEAPYVIEFANDRFFEILDLDRLDFEKNPGIINDFIYEADKAGFVKMNVEANLNVSPFIWEGRFMINNNPVWIHFESIPRVLANGDIIWTGTLNDVSIRKNSELEIVLKNQELEKLNAEKVKFLSIIAHDLKSPFSTVIGFSEFLMEKIKEKDYEQIDEFANAILHSSNRIMELLMNLMEWAQSHTERIEVNPVHFDIGDFINETILLYHDIAVQKSISIRMNLPQILTVFADKAMIGTVLRNLISNAIKFTMPGGEVIISVAEEQDEIIFSVRDTGVGIAKSSIGNLFRIDKSYSTFGTNKEKGSGLGLILCKEFVEKQGGKIWVESEEQIGSTFFFTLPQAEM